jgi:threonine dehydrogenase-like Zn-dependent dehydrogenase
VDKNITIQMGNCNHRRYVPHLVDLVASGTVDPVGVLTQIDTLSSGIEAYEAFDRREPGWLKVELEPAAA